jgi:hypothetical protein
MKAVLEILAPANPGTKYTDLIFYDVFKLKSKFSQGHFYLKNVGVKGFLNWYQLYGPLSSLVQIKKHYNYIFYKAGDIRPLFHLFNNICIH